MRKKTRIFDWSSGIADTPELIMAMSRAVTEIVGKDMPQAQRDRVDLVTVSVKVGDKEFVVHSFIQEV